MVPKVSSQIQMVQNMIFSRIADVVNPFGRNISISSGEVQRKCDGLACDKLATSTKLNSLAHSYRQNHIYAPSDYIIYISSSTNQCQFKGGYVVVKISFGLSDTDSLVKGAHKTTVTTIVEQG